YESRTTNQSPSLPCPAVSATAAYRLQPEAHRGSDPHGTRKHGGRYRGAPEWRCRVTAARKFHQRRGARRHGSTRGAAYLDGDLLSSPGYFGNADQYPGDAGPGESLACQRHLQCADHGGRWWAVAEFRRALSRRVGVAVGG